MTIAVCAKITPDTAQLRTVLDTGAPRLDETPQRISTFDENALEAAVRLKERHGGRILLVSLVSAAPPPELVLRALAVGADEAFLVEAYGVERADALATTRILAAAIHKLPTCDLILCGEGSLDAYDRQVGPRLAEAIGLPVLTHVTKIELAETRVVVHRALEDCTTVVSTGLPAVLTVGQEINEPRFPTVLQIMSASRKPKTHWRLEELGFANGIDVVAMSGVETLEIRAPQVERRRVAIEGGGPKAMAVELARRLFELGLVRTP